MVNGGAQYSKACEGRQLRRGRALLASAIRLVEFAADDAITTAAPACVLAPLGSRATVQRALGNKGSYHPVSVTSCIRCENSS